jgi:hypothetical protein
MRRASQEERIRDLFEVPRDVLNPGFRKYLAEVAGLAGSPRIFGFVEIDRGSVVAKIGERRDLVAGGEAELDDPAGGGKSCTISSRTNSNRGCAMTLKVAYPDIGRVPNAQGGMQARIEIRDCN